MPTILLVAADSRMTPKARSIVEQLRHAIEHSGETQYAIVQATGVSQSVLNRFINGERGISLETAAKLCQYLASTWLPVVDGVVGSNLRSEPRGGPVLLAYPFTLSAVKSLDRPTQ